MPIRLTSLLCGGILLVSAASASAAASFNVGVRVEGAKKTLVPEKTVTLADAPIIKDGSPDHSCPGQTALGALQQGTQGDWAGTWYDSPRGYLVTTIRGVKPTGSDFFELWVNHRQSSVGFCDATLHAGADVLVIQQHCTFNPKTNKCPGLTPLGLRAPRFVKKGHKATLTVVAYSPSGRATPVHGAQLFANGKLFGKKTDKHGQVAVQGLRVGAVDVYATDAGHVRSVTDTVRVRK